MTVAAKLALFGLALIVVFVASVGVGRVLGPSNEGTEDHGGHPARSASEPG